MANIETNGNFYPHQTDLRQLILIKCRTKWNCRICNNEIPSGSYCIGKTESWYSYRKCCLNCAKKFLNNFIESINEFKQVADDTLKDIKKNEKKYQAVNSVARI